MRARTRIALSALLAAGCSSKTGDSFQVTVVDGSSKAPVAGALVAVENGGIYLPNPNPSKGNPSYQFGGQADASGIVTLTNLPDGDLGFHAFGKGYKYGPLGAKRSKGSATVDLEGQTAADLLPTCTNVHFDAASATAGASVTLRATAAAANKSNPLSEEILVVLPSAGWAAEMDPPSAGMPGVVYPDGEYKKTFSAPAAAGSYSYYVVTATEGCTTSAAVQVTLEVK